MTGGGALLRVGLEAPTVLLEEIADFYGRLLQQAVEPPDGRGIAMRIGETTLEWRVGDGEPFYHFAFLVPGDRFGAALAWAEDRLELLPDRDTGEPLFDFTNWDARAVYFHDPAGSIVELIAHRGIGDNGASGAFAPAELTGFSEIGVVCDPPAAAEALERELGLELWDGTVDGENRLAFVGEKARTLILCRAGRPWLPTGRPAEAHPVEVMLAGVASGTVHIGDGSCVSVKAS